MGHLTIRNLSGQELELELSDGETAFHVKEKIHEHWGLPPKCQELILQSAALADAYSFADAGDKLELLLVCSLRQLCVNLGSSSAAARAAALQDLAAVRGSAGAVEAALQCLEETGDRGKKREQTLKASLNGLKLFVNRRTRVPTCGTAQWRLSCRSQGKATRPSWRQPTGSFCALAPIGELRALRRIS